MSRPPSDPVARLGKLEAARAAIEPGETFNGNEMARVVGMTWRHFSQLVSADQNFPVQQQGSEGVPFIFNGAAVLEHMIAKAKAAVSQREATTARASRLAGLGGTDGPLSGRAAGPGSGAREMLEDARAINALADAQAKLRAEKQKQRELVDRAEVQSLVWDMMTTMQAETMGITSKLDRAGQWEPAFREEVEGELGNVLLHVRAKLEKRIAAWDAPKH